MSRLRYFDPEIAKLIKLEGQRQKSELTLVASENYASQATLEAQGSIVNNKLSQGYIGSRVSGGCQYIDQIEDLAIKRAKELFGAEHVNVQAATSSIANLAVYQALLNPGDLILSLRREHGGHTTHGIPANLSGKFYRAEFYELDPVTERLNYEAIRKLALSCKPRMIIAGFTNYSRTIDFSVFRKIADEVGAYLFVDMAHFVGLVIAGLHPDPVPYADVVTTSTHKTFRGPRGSGIILCKKEYAQKIDQAVSPGVQSAPMMDVIASRAVLLKEAKSPQFKAYQHQIVKNSKALAEFLISEGFKIFSGGTETHVMLVNIRNQGITGDVAESVLDNVGITVNKSKVPFDTNNSPKPGGIRLGPSAVTTRGMKEGEMKHAAKLIASVIKNQQNQKILDNVRKEVKQLTKRFPLFSKEWEPQPDCDSDF
jgi:glycine hydroxymethyltransferase